MADETRLTTENAPRQRGLIISVLLAPGFWVNLLGTLLLSCWLPGLHTVLKKEDGTILQEFSIPLYNLYWRLIQGEYSTESLRAIGMHLGIVFVVTFAIWMLFGRRRFRKAQATE